MDEFCESNCDNPAELNLYAIKGIDKKGKPIFKVEKLCRHCAEQAIHLGEHFAKIEWIN